MRRAHDETATKNFRRFPYLGGRSRLRHDPLFPLHSQETGMENHRGAPAPNPRSGGFPTTVVGPPGKLGSHDFRTMAERINARLKDEFGARFVRVRGAIKVKCHLVFGLVALTVDQILRVTSFRPALT